MNAPPLNPASEPAEYQTADVQTLIDQHPFSGWQWLVFSMCFLIVLLDGFDTAAIGYIAPSLLKDWNLSRPALGSVLSAALFGVAVGALGAGPVADRFGRKLVLWVSVLIFGVATYASAYVTSIDQLTALRFITGIGLGAAMPNAVTLMNEYCPVKRRSTISNLMFCGFPLGAALGGFVAAWMIPLWGWRSVLMLGGSVPLVLAVLLIWKLPESVRFLVTRSTGADRIRAALAPITGAVVNRYQHFTLGELGAGTRQTGGLVQVLSGPYRIGSLMLWISYFMGLVIFYALINWMPLLFKDAGLDPKTATLIAALFPLGGIGAVGFGWIMDRWNGTKTIAIGFFLTTVAVCLIGQTVGMTTLALVTVVFIAGTLMNTSQSSLPALAASFYPTISRATGVAWMMGIGRFGGIIGSMLVSWLSAAGMNSPQEVFSILALPGFIAAIALLIKLRFEPTKADAETGKPAPASLSH